MLENPLLKIGEQIVEMTKNSPMTKLAEQMKDSSLFKLSEQIAAMKSTWRLPEMPTFEPPALNYAAEFDEICDNPVAQPAKFIVESLNETIKAIEAVLPDDKKMTLIVFAGGVPCVVEYIGYVGPLLVRFTCEDGDEVLLHHASVQFLVKWTDKDKKEERKFIGFRV